METFRGCVFICAYAGLEFNSRRHSSLCWSGPPNTSSSNQAWGHDFYLPPPNAPTNSSRARWWKLSGRDKIDIQSAVEYWNGAQTLPSAWGQWYSKINPLSQLTPHMKILARSWDLCLDAVNHRGAPPYKLRSNAELTPVSPPPPTHPQPSLTGSRQIKPLHREIWKAFLIRVWGYWLKCRRRGLQPFFSFFYNFN